MRTITRQQLQSTARGRQLYAISLAIVQNMETLLYKSPQDTQQVSADIEALRGQLIAQGITTNIHVGKAKKPSQTQPSQWSG